MKTIVLEVGNTYKDRNGNIYLISENTFALNKHLFPFLGENIKTKKLYAYTELGRYLVNGNRHELDLIKLITKEGEQ